jgi:hypothetical protein
MMLTVLETLKVKVDWDLPPDEHVIISGLNPDHWVYRGSPALLAPKGTTESTIAIVTLDETMAIGEIVPWVLAKTQSGFHGSGAWVREGYLSARPDYDGKGAILFPDEGRSLWADNWETRSDGLCVPGIWHDNGRMGPRSLDWIGDKWRAGKRIALRVF